jgi:hypothetical protein
VVRAVGEQDPHVHHGVAGQDPVGEGLLDAGVDGGDVLLRDHPAGDLVHELVAAPGPGGLEADHDVAVLAPAAGLADVAALDLLHEHLEVELAHARDHGLVGLVVGPYPEGRVLLA